MTNTYNKIRLLSEKYRDYTTSVLSSLVKIKSLSLGEEKVQLEVKKQMIESGVDEVFIDGLGNVIGRIGTGNKIIAFDGHIDTVDVGSLGNWKLDPFSGLVADEYVHGRGSVDQKGGIASMITAIRIIKELELGRDYTIYFVSSVMEEDCDGLCWKYIIEEENIKPDVVIITEPTNLGIYLGQRGRMEIQMEFDGVSAHGSAPERGINAIYKASQASLKLESLNHRLTGDNELGKGSLTVSEFLSNSPSLCAVSDYARLHIDRRLTIGETKESVFKELEAISEHAKINIPLYNETAYTGLTYGMEKYYPTWIMDKDHTIVQTGISAFSNLYNDVPRLGNWTFSTNGVIINGIYNIPIIGFGPGNETYAHAPNEKVPINDLVIASAFYAAFVCAQ